jgi:hypothetical protein
MSQVDRTSSFVSSIDMYVSDGAELRAKIHQKIYVSCEKGASRLFRKTHKYSKSYRREQAITKGSRRLLSKLSTPGERQPPWYRNDSPRPGPRHR